MYVELDKKQNASLRIYSSLGQCVYEQKINEAKNTLKLNTMVPGVYTLEILSNEGRVLKRIVKD